jgi:hypothetical protein
MFEDAQHVVDTFRKEYEPFQAELQKTIKQFKDNKAFFDFLIKIRNLDSDDLEDDLKKEEAAKGGKDGKAASKKTSLGFSTDILRVVKGALSDRTLLRYIDYVDMLNEEEVKLKAMPAVFINSAAGIRIQQDINTAKTVAVDNTGNLVRNRYERLLAEIHDFLNQGTRVEIEILKALRGELDIEIAAEQEVSGPTVEEQKIKSDAEHQLWPFEGEFWRDELGFYRQPITNRCGR